MDTSQIRGRRPLKEVNGETTFSENGILFLEDRLVQHRARRSLEERLVQHQARRSLVLWRSPLRTLYYFVMETLVLLHKHGLRLLRRTKLLVSLLLIFTIFLSIYYSPGPHQNYVDSVWKQVVWCAYWVGLGILSSVGLGTGLHTFLLYLGPHVAAVTLAAFECMSVDFPSPPYPDDIVCPEVEGSSMSLWTIMSKVRTEAFMWGAGTAIGELPPYFMARASRLSGEVDEEEQEIENLLQERRDHPSELSILDRGKILVHNMIQKVGFVGILLCASIPNPLFDLAGITCGHFLVPFWTFFSATMIGKAVIKMHIQKIFVIFVFSEHHVEQVVSLIKYIPYFGPSLQAPFKEYLVKQKRKLHHKRGDALPAESSWLSSLYEKLVIIMIIYFVISIVNSMAQSYHKRRSRQTMSVAAASKSEKRY